ncbi:uncharacterized protein LOC142468183 [Ascaphus truei]|uniref:uncharacterized protein LOC142468183 n=1 Tax=Ascaphus truei TaxID=8439 RepID=UPI003F5A9790
MQQDWVDLLPWAEFALNSLRNDSTQESPFFINCGFHPSRLPFSSLSSGVPAVDKRISRLKDLWTRIQENLKVATGRQKLQADRLRRQVPEFAPGDKVWLSSRNIRLKVPTMKLAPKFLGPFPVVRRVNPVAYHLRLPPSMKIPSVFHVSLLKPVFQSPRFSKNTSPPLPLTIQGQQEYEVQFILDSRISRGGVQYLVHWKGFGPEERSWIPHRDLHAPRLLQAFHHRNPSKPCHGRPEVAPEGGGGTVRKQESRGARRAPYSPAALSGSPAARRDSFPMAPSSGPLMRARARLLSSSALGSGRGSAHAATDAATGRRGHTGAHQPFKETVPFFNATIQFTNTSRTYSSSFRNSSRPIPVSAWPIHTPPPCYLAIGSSYLHIPSRFINSSAEHRTSCSHHSLPP